MFRNNIKPQSLLSNGSRLCLLHAGFLLGLCIDLKMEAICCSETRHYRVLCELMCACPWEWRRILTPDAAFPL
jgi:hypothetical protein